VNIVKKAVPAIVVLFLSLVMVGNASPAAAAGADVDVAYQYLHISSGGSGDSAPAGFAAGVAVPLQSSWSVVGDFGWNRKSLDSVTDSHFTATSIGGGLRYTPKTMTSFVPYVQAVAGVEMDKVSTSSSLINASSTQNNFMLQPGVGAAFGVEHLKAFVEANYRWVHQSGESANDAVLRAGLIFNIGK
jgi:hypothetical protein